MPVLNSIKYAEQERRICGDLKIIAELSGMQLAYNKGCCFLCMSVSSDRISHCVQAPTKSLQVQRPGRCFFINSRCTCHLIFHLLYVSGTKADELFYLSYQFLSTQNKEELTHERKRNIKFFVRHYYHLNNLHIIKFSESFLSQSQLVENPSYNINSIGLNIPTIDFNLISLLVL